jgi:GNAT superfamily N-acetyltransferase
MSQEHELTPPVECCGREFRLRRALECHQSNHQTCTLCNFSACKAVLKRHAWDVHRIGSEPPPNALPPDALPPAEQRRTIVVDEPEPKPQTLEERFPGADIMWELNGRTAATDPGPLPAEPMPAAAGESGSLAAAPCAMAWPAGCRIVLVLGRNGSGKSQLLRSMCPSGLGTLETEAAHWAPNRSLLDGLGPDAVRWLGAVGLGSVPLWGQPYAALSTGEAFRAQLARQLQATERASLPLVVDGFCDHLDGLSAGCCAASLSRHLRSKEGCATHALLASCRAQIAHYLRPDVVILCRARRPPLVLRNTDSSIALPLQITVYRGRSGAEDGAQERRAGISSTGGELFVERLRRCGLPIRATIPLLPVCQEAERMDIPRAELQRDRVLASRVERTEATRMCDTLFDYPHDGICARRLPPFPSEEHWARWASSAPDGSPSFRIGFICGPSGASKSALLALHFGAPSTLPWGAGVELARCFVSAAQAARCLRAASLPASAGSWQRDRLSAGEMAQARLALALAAAECGREGDGPPRLALCDEYGSAWDDQVACQVSRSLTEAMVTDDVAWRLQCRGAILAGCHAHFVGPHGLQPDWAFEAASATCFFFTRTAVDHSTPHNWLENSSMASTGDVRTMAEGVGLEEWESLEKHVRADGSAAVHIPPPRFDLQLRQCDPSAWQRFHTHHYKTSELSNVATCFLLEASISNGPKGGVSLVPAGFVATIPHSGKRTEHASAPPQRAHRTVVLPEFQGLGIGSRLSDAAAEWHHLNGSDYYGQTAHPRFGAYRDLSPLWEPLEANHTAPQLRWLPRRLTGVSQSNVIVRRRHPKLVYAHRYIGCDSLVCSGKDGTETLCGWRRSEHLRARLRFVNVD